jgi:hypothetical protein
MSSTEPPSRNNPRNQAHDTKAARDELSSKGKVEKVREIDADEQTRKQRFQRFYKEDEIADEKMEQEVKPSPFDLYAGQDRPIKGSSSLSDSENGVIPGSAYPPAPNLDAFSGDDEAGEEQATQGALPQSDDFWSDFDLPDQTPPPANFQEMTSSSKEGSQASKKQNSLKGSTDHQEKTENPHSQAASHKNSSKSTPSDPKAKEVSPFGLPGKPELKRGEKSEPSNPKKPKQDQLPSPFDMQAKIRPVEKEEERYTGPIISSPRSEKKENKIKTNEENLFVPDADVRPYQRGEKDSNQKDQKKEGKITEIEPPSRSALPTQIQPLALNAVSQAEPYLNPTTASLFYQMVGTMYVMAGPQGINRTEIVLNNPSYANSKFFGSTITIEKYATAPDSFNIRLTGSQEAVVTFKENIPSLMNAFANGNFTFKVNRLDVEYTLERPVFRRKEKEEGRRDAGDGDLGERRK